MAVHSPRRKLTYADFVRIPEDLLRHEILDGEHVVSPAPTEAHQDCLGELYLEIGLYLRGNPCGKVFFAPFDVLLSEHDVVEPDLLFVSSARLGILTGKYALGAPDLVVEVLSPSTRRRDLGKKRARYELLGVGEYWILDPQRRTATVLRRQGEAFLPPLHLSAEAGDRLTTPLLSGLEIPLSEIFRR